MILLEIQPLVLRGITLVFIVLLFAVLWMLTDKPINNKNDEQN